MTDFGTSTNFEESINICLMALGERAVTNATTLLGSGQNRVPHLCIRVLDEVTKDVEARGWWFQSSRGAIIGLSGTVPQWNAAHPEEFRRYVTIRSARILQTRYITDETLHKLTLEEEIYSKAVLEAKDAQQDSSVTFALPQAIENLGIREVMFLQSNMEEKLATLKLGTELQQTSLVEKQVAKTLSEQLLIDAQELLVDQQKLTEVNTTTKVLREGELLAAQELKTDAEKLLVDAQASKTTAETALIADQEALVTQQALTEAEETAKRTAEKDLLLAQELKVDQETAKITADRSLIAQQTTKVQKEALLLTAQELKVDAETALIADQEALVVKQALTEVAKATDIGADTTLKGKQGALIDSQELKTDAETTLTTKQGALVDAQELKTDAEKLLVDAQELKTDAETATEASRKLDIEADTTLKGKQGALVDAQELKTDAETTLTTKQGLLVDAQELKTDAETTLTTRQGLLVNAQELKTDAEKLLVDAQAALTADQEAKTVSEKELLDSQKTKLDAETAYMITAERDYFQNGGVAISGESGYFSYKDFRPEMRILGITEAQYQEYPAYKKEDLIKDAHKIRSEHTTNNLHRNSQEVSLNTHMVMDRGRDLDDFHRIQFYGESNSTINGNPISVPQREYFAGFNDTGALVAGTTDKHLADGNPKGYTLSSNIQNGLEEDGSTTFSDDNAGNTDAITYSYTTANRSFLSNFGVHVKRPQIDEIVTARTFKVSMWVNFYQPSNNESSKYLLKVIGDNSVTVYLDDVQVGIKDYVPYRWEDENTLASYRFNWDRPQDIYLTNVIKGFHKLTFEYNNFTDVGNSLTARNLGGNTNQANPQYAGQYDNYHRLANNDNSNYVNENTTNTTVMVFSNAVTFAAQLFPISDDSTATSFNFFNTATSSTTLGADGTAFSIWDTVKQVGLGTYHEEDLEVVNDILRLIGEPPVNDFHTNALAIETFNLMRKTDTELQARGWDFNTERDIYLGTDFARINTNDHVSTTSSVYKKAYIQIVDSDNILSFEANDYKTRMQRLTPDVTYKVLFNTETREIYDWFDTSKGVKGTAIVQRDLTDVPQKYKEYLTVRTALIITELYPKSGVDLQRLPKMEQELSTYFKDRENDHANYNIFDNYDTAERIGFNRNYDLN